MSDPFPIDPRLLADTIFVKSLQLCDLLVMNDARYRWAILVPRIRDARELHDLDPAQNAAIWSETMMVARAIAAFEGVTKVNIGALGNVVPQLHIHVIGRSPTDPAWPGPVWGHSPRMGYQAEAEQAFVEYLYGNVR